MFASPSAGLPNNPLPLIIWPRVVPEDEENIATWFEETFEKNGWPPDWRDQLFPYMHYHPNTHELLGVAEGWAEVLFGGDSDYPAGRGCRADPCGCRASTGFRQ